jgi:hypothetical protein
MEREREIARLVNVLRQTARMAMQSEWTGGADDTAGYCAEQYNRVLARLRELEPGLTPVFEPLPPGSSLTVAAMACRQLGAYFEDEAGRGRPWGRGHRGGGPGGAHAFRFDGSTIKDIWRESAQEVEDLGEFIRESVEEWSRRRRGGPGQRPSPPPPPSPPQPPPPPRPPDEGHGGDL